MIRALASSSLSRRAPAFARAQLCRSFGSTGPNLDNYDVCVVGGGPGGYVAAIKAAQLQSVASTPAIRPISMNSPFPIFN